LTGAVGPSFLICYRSDCDPPGDIVQFYGALDFGWHLTGEGFEGPAIGANLHGGYGRVRGWDTGRFGAAFKFWWDIQPDDDLGVYVTPTAQAGHTSFFFEANRGCYYNPAGVRICPYGTADQHFFNLQVGAAVRLVLNDLGLLYFQPITLDTVFNGNGAGLLWRLELGGGVIFGD
jgi:hypothetical protein